MAIENNININNEEGDPYTIIYNNDEFIDADYVEVVNPATIDNLASHYEIGRGSMNSLIVKLEKRKALSTWARPKGSWRKFTFHDLKIIDACIKLMRAENLSIAATVNKITGIVDNTSKPNEEFYYKMKEANTQFAFNTSMLEDKMQKMFQEAFELINKKFEEAETSRKKMEEKLLEITSSAKSEEINKQRELIEELRNALRINQEEIERLKMELQNEKDKNFFKKFGKK